jgi:hypothetical protein
MEEQAKPPGLSPPGSAQCGPTTAEPEIPGSKARPGTPDSNQGKPKTADRPHWITICLGLLSPALALIALWFSLQSLKISDRSLVIGQQAYVSLQNGSLSFSKEIEGPTPQPSSTLTPGQPHPYVAMLGTVTLVNTGNTPAQFVSFKPVYKQLPQGWSIRNTGWVPANTTPPFLSAKSQVSWRFQQTFWLTPEAWSDFFGGPMPVLSLVGELEYNDVFDNPHRINWCWDTFAQANNQGQVADCFAMKRVP